VSCVDNSLDEKPNDSSYPFQLVLDEEEGGTLAGESDYAVEVTFADYIGELPAESVTLSFEITDVQAEWLNILTVDKVVYEVEVDDCTFEREIPFTMDADNLSGTITLLSDEDLKTLPESFEVVFVLPEENEGVGAFTFTITGVESSNENIIAGMPAEFEYETLENDVAGEWEIEITDEEQFNSFKEVFGQLNNDLEALEFSDITGAVTLEFEYSEVKISLELTEEEETTFCEDGEQVTEVENKVIEIEAEYEAEDGELSFEGSHFIVGDDGEIEEELDFQLEAAYEETAPEELSFVFFKLIDEDNYEEGEELFNNEDGISFVFKR
jgi:hypothetical protein